jgi:transcriptional regulator with XRE-family HTH domain
MKLNFWYDGDRHEVKLHIKREERPTMRYNLYSERKARDFTQKEMAGRFGVTERHYQALETGTSRGSMKFWEAAKEYFKKPIDHLMETRIESSRPTPQQKHT